MKHPYRRYLSNRIFFLIIMFLLILSMFVAYLFKHAFTGKISLFIPIIAAVVLISLIYCIYRWCYLPYKEIEKVLLLFATGYTLEGMYDMRYTYTPTMDTVILKIKELLNTDKLLNANKRQAQFLALQNQINPHFLYNTLEGIRSEAIVSGLTSIGEMTEALASFFRYTISKVESLVSVEEEIKNTETYFLIQQYRFGERLNLVIDCDEGDREIIYRLKIPKLTLQPIVENSIIHGIERKLGRGTIYIRLRCTIDRLLIRVSDDGVGMDEEILGRLNKNLSSTIYTNIDQDKPGGIAMVNVNNRIRLLFGESYGIVVYSIEGVGTDVDVTLPKIFNERDIKRDDA